MSNKLIIVIFIVILLGGAGTPLYVLGKQKAELESRILELEVTSTELENTIDELQVIVAAQSDTTEEPQWGDESAHKAQELLDCATVACGIWEGLMDVSAELGNFYDMLIIGDMFYENEANNVLLRLQELEQRLVRLDTPPDAVVLRDSLQSQYDLLELYYTKIILAWTNIANQNVFNQYMSEASALYLNEFLPLAENNQRDLSEVIDQAEYELSHT